MYELDAALTRLANGSAGQHLLVDPLMIAVSQFGVPVLVALVAIQWWRRKERSAVRHGLVAAGLSFMLGLALNQLVLLLVHRVRPYDAGVSHLIIPPSADWSLPSDHATAAMAIAAAFLIYGRTRAGVLFLAAALLMMVSRVYVGIHYAGDVLSGGLTGILAAAAVYKVYRQGTRLDRLVTGIF